jgi:hypothetical protein
MKECDNSTRKIHKSNNFILSISLLIMFETLLLRPSLHCNTPLHFTQLHFTILRYTSPSYTSLYFATLYPTTLHNIYRHFTSFHLHFTTLSFSFTHLHFLSFYFSSHHYTRHSTDLTSKHISKIMNLQATSQLRIFFSGENLKYSYVLGIAYKCNLKANVRPYSVGLHVTLRLYN